MAYETCTLGELKRHCSCSCLSKQWNPARVSGTQCAIKLATDI